MTKADKILSIQYLRGLAALAVVFCHFGMFLFNHPKLAAAFSYGQIGVVIFFFISGFIIVYSLEQSGYKTDSLFYFPDKKVYPYRSALLDYDRNIYSTRLL